MRAIIASAYGTPDVLKPVEIPQPVPGDKELLIRVKATTITAGDCEIRSFTFPPLFRLPMRLFMGIRKPGRAILGQELAGEVVGLGAAVKGFKIGDRVFGSPLMKLGTYAEYCCIPEKYPLLQIPDAVSDEDAATIMVGGLNALYFVKLAKIVPGEQVMIIGAGGSIGTYAIQLVCMQGGRVTAVDRGDKLDRLMALGAEVTVDYTREDYYEKSERYDVIIDLVSNRSRQYRLSGLKRGGRYVLANFIVGVGVHNLFSRLFLRKQVQTGMAKYTSAAMSEFAIFLASGKLMACVDKRCGLEQIPDMHRYVEQGNKVGHIIVVP